LFELSAMKESINNKVLISVGILLTFGVLYSFVLWLSLTVDDKISFETARQLYLSNYPSFLRNARALTVLHIILNMLAITCLLHIQRLSLNVTRLVKYFIILNIVMLIWQLFSLM
jgi:hypothetical protein